jgi:hypothetical protein
MSNAADSQPPDHINVQHQQTDLFQTIQPIAWASGTSDWVLQLVLRDKPNGAAPAQVRVWSQNGACTSFTAVPVTQRYASSTVSIPNAVDRRGIAVGVTGTGAAQHAFAPGEVLCMSILPTSGSGSNDVNFYGDTFSTSGLTGRSALFGPFSFATAPYLLHQATTGGNRSMSTSASGAVNDQVTVGTGSTVTFQSTSPILNASGLSPWPLLVVIRDPLALLGSGQAQVWKQTSACTTYASQPAASRFASGTFAIPLGLSSNTGVAASLPGTGSAVTTLGASEVLCLAVTNTGLSSFVIRLDTPAAAGSPGKSSLGGPFAQVAGVRASGPPASPEDGTSLLTLLGAWLALLAGSAAAWRVTRMR